MSGGSSRESPGYFTEASNAPRRAASKTRGTAAASTSASNPSMSLLPPDCANITSSRDPSLSTVQSTMSPHATKSNGTRMLYFSSG